MNLLAFKTIKLTSETLENHQRISRLFSYFPFYSIYVSGMVKIEISVCHLCSQEVVLSSEQDAFFKANMYDNFGEIGMNIKKMVDDFQQVAKSNQNIQTIGSPPVTCSALYAHLFSFATGSKMLMHLNLCRGYG